MSQETTTQLPGLPTEHGVPAEDGEAFSAAEVDQRSTSRMLRVLMLFAWALAGAVSIGVADSASGQSADQILKRAGEGLYAAKNSGRNKVVTV